MTAAAAGCAARRWAVGDDEDAAVRAIVRLLRPLLRPLRRRPTLSRLLRDAYVAVDAVIGAGCSIRPVSLGSCSSAWFSESLVGANTSSAVGLYS